MGSMLAGAKMHSMMNISSVMLFMTEDIDTLRQVSQGIWMIIANDLLMVRTLGRDNDRAPTCAEA